jgi:hypothetical protein
MALTMADWDPTLRCVKLTRNLCNYFTHIFVSRAIKHRYLLNVSSRLTGLSSIPAYKGEGKSKLCSVTNLSVTPGRHNPCLIEHYAMKTMKVNAQLHAPTALSLLPIG